MFHGKAFVRGSSGIISLSDRDYFGGFGLNQELQLGHKFFKKEGNFRAGFWNFNFRAGSSKPFATPLDTSPSGLLSILPGGTPTHGGPVGCYFSFDQRLWKNIGLFGRYGFNDKQLGEIFPGGCCLRGKPGRSGLNYQSRPSLRSVLTMLPVSHSVLLVRTAEEL